jgi:hypothetical protein
MDLLRTLDAAFTRSKSSAMVSIEIWREGHGRENAYAAGGEKMKTAIFLLGGILLGESAWAQHWHDDKEHWKQHQKHDDNDRGYDHRAGGCHFEPHDVRVIREYYAPRYRNLPPGLEKKLYRTGHLPPGWERRVQPMPEVVERELVPVPTGYRRGFIDGYAVVYDPGTRIIIDVTAIFGR